MKYIATIGAILFLVGCSSIKPPLLPKSTAETSGWSGPHKKHSFFRSFVAGHEADGRKLFISQCVLRDTTVSSSPPFYTTKNRGWHIGKAGVHLASGMTFPWKGKEMESNHCRKKEHFVFVGVPNVSYSWVKASNGNFPTGSVRGYNGHENQKVCRVKHGGGIHPGKLIPRSKACFIPYGGKEMGFGDYEVLVGKLNPT